MYFSCESPIITVFLLRLNLPALLCGCLLSEFLRDDLCDAKKSLSLPSVSTSSSSSFSAKSSCNKLNPLFVDVSAEFV